MYGLYFKVCTVLSQEFNSSLERMAYRNIIGNYKALNCVSWSELVLFLDLEFIYSEYLISYFCLSAESLVKIKINIHPTKCYTSLSISTQAKKHNKQLTHHHHHHHGAQCQLTQL